MYVRVSFNYGPDSLPYYTHPMSMGKASLLSFTILSLLDTQPLVSCRSYSDAHSQQHVFFLFFLFQSENHVLWFRKKKNCNRSVKWNLSLWLFVHVRSMPLGNRTHVLVRCCVPNKDHPSSTLLHPIYWFWTMIIKIIDFSSSGKMYL